MNSKGQNAFVSSIQKSINVDKGVTLCHQIVGVNGANMCSWEHNAITGFIKETTTPVTLRFQHQKSGVPKYSTTSSNITSNSQTWNIGYKPQPSGMKVSFPTEQECFLRLFFRIFLQLAKVTSSGWLCIEESTSEKTEDFEKYLLQLISPYDSDEESSFSVGGEDLSFE